MHNNTINIYINKVTNLKYIFNYINKNKITYIENNVFIYNNNKVIYEDKYISNIKIKGNYYREIEIIAANKLFHLSIYVLEKTENLNGYRFLYNI